MWRGKSIDIAQRTTYVPLRKPALEVTPASIPLPMLALKAGRLSSGRSSWAWSRRRWGSFIAETVIASSVFCVNIVMIATTAMLVARVGQNMSFDVPIVTARRPAQTMAAITKLATMARTCFLLNSAAPHSGERSSPASKSFQGDQGPNDHPYRPYQDVVKAALKANLHPAHNPYDEQDKADDDETYADGPKPCRTVLLFCDH